MTYQIEILCVNNATREKEWRKLRPTNCAPYVFLTKTEAEETAAMCYPDHQEYVRIISQ